MNTLNHDDDDPTEHLNLLEASWLAATTEKASCPHCRITADPIPMAGPGWAVEVIHERHCPQHDDSLPTPERPTGPGELS